MPLEASVPGVFAAGDVRHGSVKGVASAVGEGTMGIQMVHRRLDEVSNGASIDPSRRVKLNLNQ
jgi:thioredoxin reductase